MHPEPLGDDHLAARRHGLAAMPRGRVGRAIVEQVVPEQRHSRLGSHRVVDLGEARGAALHALVEIHHEGPGAIAAHTGVTFIGVGTGFEIIPVRLELLAGLVVLNLYAFRVRGVDTERPADALIDGIDEAAAQVPQERGSAGAKLPVVSVVRQCGGAEPRLDQRDELRALRRRHELIQRVKRDSRHVEAAQTRGRLAEDGQGLHGAIGERVSPGADGLERHDDRAIGESALAQFLHTLRQVRANIHVHAQPREGVRIEGLLLHGPVHPVARG